MFKLFRLGASIIKSNFMTLRSPYKLTFAITYSCNSRCKTCNIWKRKPENEMKTWEIRSMFEKINPSWVNLTGGEPFLRKDIYDIAKFASKSAYLLNLTTNGLLVNKILKDVKEISKIGIPRFIVVVSLDGPEEIHDKIRGIKGNWGKALKVFGALKNLSESKKNFHTYFGYTISQYNLGLIEKTVESVKEKIDVSINDFHFNIYHVSSLYYGNNGEKVLEKKFLKDVEYVLKEKKNLGIIPFIESKYLKLIKKYFTTGMSPVPCRALTSSCFIDPQGNVYPCTHWGMKLGNLRESNYDLKKLWNSKKANEARKLIKKNKCPGCWTPCEAYQTILGNILRI